MLNLNKKQFKAFRAECAAFHKIKSKYSPITYFLHRWCGVVAVPYQELYPGHNVNILINNADIVHVCTKCGVLICIKSNCNCYLSSFNNRKVDRIFVERTGDRMSIANDWAVYESSLEEGFDRLIKMGVTTMPVFELI